MNSMADALSFYLVFNPGIIIYTPLTLLKLLAKGHHQHRTAIKILDHRGLPRMSLFSSSLLFMLYTVLSQTCRHRSEPVIVVQIDC